MQTRVNVSPSSEDEKILRCLLNFINPCWYTPAHKFRETIIAAIPYQELKTLYLPYSPVVRSRVNIGVVIIDMPFCKNEHIKNQNEAFTGFGKDLYLLASLFILPQIYLTISFAKAVYIFLCIYPLVHT